MKRILPSILLAVFFLFMSGMAMAQTATAPAEGDGTVDSPYQIATLENLYWIAADSGRWSAHYIQTADIDASATSGWDGGAGWTPIGTSVAQGGTAFTGTYDGAGHTISGLFINRLAEDFQGLFGATEGATINNLGVADVDITGKQYVGGLVGSNGGALTNTYVTGKVEADNEDLGGLTGQNKFNATIEDSFTRGEVKGTWRVGGLVGINYGQIYNSYSCSDVYGDSYLGGLVGYTLSGAIKKSYSMGDVTGTGSDIGGLVGSSSESIEDSYAWGAVEGQWYVGGLVGRAWSGTIKNSYSTGKVTGVHGTGGLIGNNWDNNATITESFWNTDTSEQGSSGGGTGLTTAAMRTESNFTNSVWDFIDTWTMSSLITFNGFPALQWSGSFSEEPAEVGNVYQIDTLPKLVWIAENSDRWEHDYIQTADIDASTTSTWVDGSEIRGWRPIGNDTTAFTGTYDGAGHTISGLFINRPTQDYQGLFGATEGAIIENLGMVDVDITGKDYVGGLAGTCTNNGNVESSYALGSVEGSYSVGGLLGENNGCTIASSYASGSVSGSDIKIGGLVGKNYSGTINESSFSGEISGNSEVGGLVGENDNSGVISNSYTTGVVNGTGSDVGGLVGVNQSGEIRDSHSTNAVNGNRLVGGLVGYFHNGVINRCYAMGEVDGNLDGIGGLAGNVYFGNVNNSYAIGAVTGNTETGGLVGHIAHNTGSVDNSYATGAVTGTGNVGGLVGRNDDGTVTNSFWDTDTGGPGNDIGTGKTTVEMRQLVTYTGWDIEETTNAYSGQPYPGLRMEAGNAWQIMASYTVTYNANQATGGSVPDQQVKFHGEPLTLSHNTGNLARTGYNFVGWNTQANGNGTDYAEGVAYTANAPVALFAKWTAADSTVNVSASPGGNVYGGGTYGHGSNITVRAEANPGYVFVNWTEGNRVVSCDAQYSFTVTSSRTLQANFSPVQSRDTMTGSVNPENSGTVTGSGSYNHGASVTMAALPNQGFAVTNWIETWPEWTGYCEVSKDEQYTFQALRNRNLTANIRPKALPGVMMLLLDE
jgi:hypothetical protein